MKHEFDRDPDSTASKAGIQAQPINNHAPNKPCKNKQKQPVLYRKKSGSYRGRDSRHEPPSQKDLKKIGRQPSHTPAGTDLISERHRLAALIARMPDEVLKKALPTIESTLQKASGQPCNKTMNRSTSKGANGHKFRPAAKLCMKAVPKGPRHPNGKLKRLPKLEEPLRWPTKTFRKEYHKHGTSIVVFLRNEWADLVSAGYGELRWLRMVDDTAAAAVENFERKDPKTKKRKQLPSDVRFLREREVINLKLFMGMEVARRDHRLLHAAARRLRRGDTVTLP